MYGTYLSWRGIRGSLLGENFLSDDEVVQLDVHYRFLSSYVHPNSNRDHATFGLNATPPAQNAATETLILLYVLTPGQP